MKYFITFSLLLFHTLVFALEVPRLQAPVTDQAGMLSQNTKRSLNAILMQVHQSSQLQMAILIINDLADETLEGFSIKVVDQWKLGAKDTDQGILLLISKIQKQIRIEVGQGLEGAIPDAYAKRIIEGMKPYFKSGQFDQGVMFAVANIFKLVGIEHKGVKQKRNSTKKIRGNSIASIIFIIIFLFIFRRNPLLAIFILSGSSRRGSGGGFGSGGGGFSGGGGGFSGGGASGGW
jgi:uncharacterized protein